MLFQELIEQHRVHRFVAHRVRLALLVARHQIGVHLFHFLGHEAELRDAFRIKLFLVAEGDRFEREDCFARLAHWLDCFLEACRGSSDAEPAICAYHHLAAIHGDARDARDKGGGLGSLRADADPVRLARDTGVADIDIVTARREINASSSAYGDVAAAGRVVEKRIEPAGRVAVTDGIAKECPKTAGGILTADRVANKRRKTGGCVAIAARVTPERIQASGRVTVADSVKLRAPTPVAVLLTPVVFVKSA